jgi:hypothetical protein
MGLRLVVEEQIADLLHQLIRVRQRGGDAEMAFREASGASHPSRRDFTWRTRR